MDAFFWMQKSVENADREVAPSLSRHHCMLCNAEARRENGGGICAGSYTALPAGRNRN